MRNCAVQNCPNSDLTVLCHRFPKNRNSAQQWQSTLNLDHVPLDTLISKYTICYKHFNTTDYRNVASNSLNTNAIPQLQPNNPRKYASKNKKTHDQIELHQLATIVSSQTIDVQKVTSPVNVSDSIELLHEDPNDATEIEDNLIGTPLGSDDICILPEEQNAADALIQSIDGTGFTMLDATSCAFMNESKTFEAANYSKDPKLGNESDSGNSQDHPPDNTDSDVEVLVSESIFESQWSETDCSAIVLRFDQTNPTDSMISPCVSCNSDMSAKTNQLVGDDDEYEQLDKKQLIEIIKEQSKNIEDLNKKLEVFKSANEKLIGHFKVFRDTVCDDGDSG